MEGRTFPLIWIIVALLVAVAGVVWGGAWAGGLEPVEMCATTPRGPDAAVGYRAEASRWPPGTKCVNELAHGSKLRTVAVTVPAGPWEWVFLA